MERITPFIDFCDISKAVHDVFWTPGMRKKRRHGPELNIAIQTIRANPRLMELASMGQWVDLKKELITKLLEKYQ